MKMKNKSLLFLVFLLTCIVANAQTYSVEVKEFLSVSPQAEVIGRLYSNHTVYVYAIRDGWAKIKFNDKYAYVNANYIKAIDSSSSVSSDERQPNWQDREMAKIFFYGMLIMMFLFYQITKFATFWRINFFAFIFILVCALETGYYFGFDNLGVKDLLSLSYYSHPLWFTDPGSVGFVWGIVNSFIYYFVAVAHVLVINKLLSERYEDNCSLGFFSAIIFVVVYGFTEWLIISPTLQKILVIGLLLCQTIQFLMLMKQGLKDAIIYIICMSATILVYLQVTGWFMFMFKYIWKI
jgi:hypothetical protein